MCYVLSVCSSIIFYFLHYFLNKKKVINLKCNFIEIIVLTLLNIVFNKVCILNTSFTYSTLFTLLNSVCIYTIYYFCSNFKYYKQNSLHFLSVFLMFSISFYIEIFICNFQHFETITNKETKLEYETSSNVEVGKNSIEVTDYNETYIEIKKINKHIKNLTIDIELKGSAIPIEVTPYVTDASAKNYFQLPQRFISSSIEKSKYLVVDLVGKSNKIKLVFNNVVPGDKIVINNISINQVVPMVFSFGRFISMWFILLLIYLVRPKSFLYKYKVSDKFQFKSVIVFVFFVVMSVSIFIIVNFNPQFKEILFDSYEEYYLLAESLSKGKVYLEEKPNKSLMTMNNPYDIDERINIMNESGESYRWDWAYYNGKYYVYFGIVPCLLVFLPFYLITGTHLPIYLSIFVSGVSCILAILYFMNQLIKRYFPKTPFLIYLELCFLIIIASNLLYIFKRPCFYSIPIIYGLQFVFWGLGLWLSSLKGGQINKFKLIIGSLCIGLTLGCRPQMFISVFFGLIIFMPYLKSKRPLKDKVFNVLISLIPIILIIIGLCNYNYKRFGSIFDFGATYNLTTNDMTHKSNSLKRVFLGLFTYLFQPTVVKPMFPFVFAQEVSSSYLGKVISEPFVGGLIYNNIILVLSLCIVKLRKFFKDKNVYYFALVSTLLGIIIVIFDTIESGILPRYIADFAYLFLNSTVIIILQLYNTLKGNKKEIFLKIILLLIGFSFIYQFVFLFTDISFELQSCNPALFHKVSYLIQFWL